MDARHAAAPRLLDKQAGILGALGSTATFIGTVTIIPFMPDRWDQSAGGFPAMTGNVPFLMKDVVLLAVSLYLLKDDVTRLVLARVLRPTVLREVRLRWREPCTHDRGPVQRANRLRRAVVLR